MATNAHFVGGLGGFLFLIGTRMYFHVEKDLLGKSLVGIAGSALMLMISIVNRGVAEGSGVKGEAFGSSVLDLWTTYSRLLLKRAAKAETFSILEIGSVALLIWSLQGAVRSIVNVAHEDKGKAKKT